jgi:photosystem II stability/assembly factor-like uncharacterized protein
MKNNDSLFMKLYAVLLPIALLAFLSSCQKSAGTSTRPGWTRLGPGGGGALWSPVFSPTNPDKIIMNCGINGGTFLTHDGGQSWRLFNLKLETGSFAFDPSHPETVYAGATGLHRSVDGGKTWSLIFPNPDSLDSVVQRTDDCDIFYYSRDNYPSGQWCLIRNICVDPTDARTVYMTLMHNEGGRSWFGVFLTRDWGRSWVKLLDSPAFVHGIFTFPQSGKEVLLFSAESLYRYNPASQVLARQVWPAEIKEITAVAAGLDPDKKLVRYYLNAIPASWDGNTLRGGIFCSEDGARTWKPVNTGLPDNLAVSQDGGPAPEFAYVTCSPEDSRTAYISCTRYPEQGKDGKIKHWYGILKTADAGGHWQWVFKAGGGSGQARILDGRRAANLSASWIDENYGDGFIEMHRIGVYPKNPDVMVFTDDYRIVKTADGGKTWQDLSNRKVSDGTYQGRGLELGGVIDIALDPFDKNRIMAGFNYMGLFSSENQGRSWIRLAQGVPEDWKNTCYSVQFDPTVKDKIWAGWCSKQDLPKFWGLKHGDFTRTAAGGVCLSEDGGKTWKTSSEGLPPNSAVLQILADPKSPPEQRTVYAANFGQGVYKSVDGGRTWQAKNLGLGENRHIREVVLAGGGRLYCVAVRAIKYGENDLRELMDGAVYLSQDGGDTWSGIALPEGVRFPNSITPDPFNPHRLYLCGQPSLQRSDIWGYKRAYATGGNTESPSRGGAYLSDDDGKSWKRIFDDRRFVFSLTADGRHPGRLYLATQNWGAFRTNDYGRSWKELGTNEDIRWGHKVVLDPLNPDMLFITSFGSAVFYGPDIK